MKLLHIALLFLAMTPAAYAHGPDGDHAHGDAPASQATGGSPSRIEAFTESFELVGLLQAGELSLFVDRYETNEPVLIGKLEADLNGMKTAAKFRAERGDYVIDEAGFLNALTKAGRHALVFTLTAGNESDLLEGTLEVRATATTEQPDHFPWAWAGAGLVAALALIALTVKLRRSNSLTGK